MSRLQPGEVRRARTIALCSHGRIVDGFEYDLAGTPCDNVFRDRLCVYGPDLQERFPEDRLLVDLGVHGYLGVPLSSTSGSVQGILSALFESGPDDIDHASTLFRICADRAGAELGRLAAEEQAQQAQAELEARVAERTRALRESEADYRAFVRSASPSSAPPTWTRRREPNWSEGSAPPRSSSRCRTRRCPWSISALSCTLSSTANSTTSRSPRCRPLKRASAAT